MVWLNLHTIGLWVSMATRIMQKPSKSLIKVINGDLCFGIRLFGLDRGFPFSDISTWQSHWSSMLPSVNLICDSMLSNSVFQVHAAALGADNKLIGDTWARCYPFLFKICCFLNLGDELLFSADTICLVWELCSPLLPSFLLLFLSSKQIL